MFQEYDQREKQNVLGDYLLDDEDSDYEGDIMNNACGDAVDGRRSAKNAVDGRDEEADNFLLNTKKTQDQPKNGKVGFFACFCKYIFD